MSYKKNGQIKPEWLFPSFLTNFDLLCLHPICHLCPISGKTGTKGKKKNLWPGHSLSRSPYLAFVTESHQQCGSNGPSTHTNPSPALDTQ